MSKYVLAYDIGTTGVKTCIFEIDKTIKLIDATSEGYGLYIMPDGGAEQDGDEWWNAMAKSTKELLLRPAITEAGITASDIAGISFCSQMQGMVLVDKDGNAVRRPMSYMDQRAKEEIKEGIAYGTQIAGANIKKLIPSLQITGAVSSSVKDPMWKFKWVEKHEPEIFAKAKYWLDVKDYLTGRCTGQFKATQDSAFATLLYDTRKGKEGWSETLCKMFDIKMELLPPIIKSTDIVGGLSAKAAAELGLVPDIPVFGGGGDSSLIGVGAGCVKVGDTHIYSGTSGWVITVTDKQTVDVNAMIAAIVGAVDGKFNYFAEMETAGKAIEWALKKIVFDEVGYYSEGAEAASASVSEGTSDGTSVGAADKLKTGDAFAFMTDAINDVPAGSNGVIFTPWLHGNRCPFEDPDSTGMYFGLNLETTKAEIFKATVEGVFYHLRWMLECQAAKVRTSDSVRFVGGSALSPAFCQMLADITGRKIETVASPQNVGSVGAAAVTAVGLGLIGSIEDVAAFIPAEHIYTPDMQVHAQYERYFETFKKIYKSNKKLYKIVKGEKADE